jgi:PadR family transcriptional regulator
LVVLGVLAEEPAGWVHGYELCRATGLKAGTVYPILIRLAERGQLDARWEDDPPLGRPARHLYRLSADGAQYVATLRSEAAKPGRTPKAANTGRTPKPQVAGG